MVEGVLFTPLMTRRVPISRPAVVYKINTAKEIFQKMVEIFLALLYNCTNTHRADTRSWPAGDRRVIKHKGEDYEVPYCQ